MWKWTSRSPKRRWLELPGSVDADDTDVAVDHMSEEELLKGLEGLAPPEAQPDEEVE